jgi:hypothetical protein
MATDAATVASTNLRVRIRARPNMVPVEGSGVDSIDDTPRRYRPQLAGPRLPNLGRSPCIR